MAKQDNTARRGLSKKVQLRKVNTDAITTLAQSSAGKLLIDLSSNQKDALLAVLVYRANGLDNAGKIRPIRLWA